MNQFISPKKIYHGEGAIDRLDKIIKDLNAKKVFLLTDPVLQELGHLDYILEKLKKSQVSIEICTDVVPEPSLHIGNKIIEKVRNSGVDLVVGIGGGSALDLAKAAAVLAENQEIVEDYLNLTGKKQLEKRGLPKVLIPTTAGTGAEVTDIAVFSLEDTKDILTHEFLLADYAIVDPAFTYTLPPRVTAASGVDALTHAIEAYTSINATPLTDALAIEAMEKIAKNIRTAVWNGGDKKAREEMSIGSLLAGLSFFNAGVAGVHALAYPLGGLFKIPHGESNAVLLPYVYDHIWPACMKKMVRIGNVLHLPTDGKSERDIAIDVVKHIQNLIQDVGLPTSLSKYNIEAKDIERLVENGIEQKRLLSRSPKILNKGDIREIYQSAYEGKLTSN
ncbi:iron-containing alcohol dehydrogenase [Oceanobacillus piezotolerans]|uniref:Iron-containing alcohol dehydrogenase n=1 Tax=Oceanobacillus piezotolerans TaxID=2448030 RepID=A0A498D7X8_9BACI|nr:iron-containing alcohol dehydrogenase [Oceanobacillus piezotolerans]RLL46815.1 iron-containing alcohol dehydrogenase [Oceanobacillus piezotolerans]